MTEQQDLLLAAGVLLVRPESTISSNRGASRDRVALPGPYDPPEGCALIATVGGEPAECIALRHVEPTICEMKRLFVRPQFGRQGIGRQLTWALTERGSESRLPRDAARRGNGL